MNTFERYDCVLEGKKYDKTPFYYPSIACQTASELLGRKVNTGTDSCYFMEEKSWLMGENAHSEFVEKLHEDTIEAYRALNADIVRETLRQKQRPTKLLDDNTLLFENPDGTYKIKRYFESTQSYGVAEDTTKKPMDSQELVKKLAMEMENYKQPSYSDLEITYKDQLNFKEKAEKYFPCIFNGLGFGIPMYEIVWLETIVLEPELMKEYLLHKAKSYIPHIKFIKSKGYKFINGGMDLAMQNGPIYSPNTFRNVVYEGLKLLNDECEKEGMIYCYRTDGNIWPLFDDMFLNIGIKAYGEVDRLADMSVGKIKEKTKNLIILGNVSSATLNLGTEEQVRKEVKDSLEESEGLNYIAGPSNAIMPGTPVKNLYAMVDEIEKYK